MNSEKLGKTEAEKKAIEEDIKFLISMQTDRLASYSSVDKAFIQRKTARESRETRSREVTVTQDSNFVSHVFISTSDDDSAVSDNETHITQTAYAEESSGKRKHSRISKTGTSLFVPYDIMKNPAFVSAYVRNGISPTAMSAVLHELITVCGGDPLKVSLSYATANR